MPETRHWWKLQTSDILDLFSLLLNLITSLRNHVEGLSLGGSADPTSALLPSQKIVALIRRCCGTKL